MISDWWWEKPNRTHTCIFLKFFLSIRKNKNLKRNNIIIKFSKEKVIKRKWILNFQSENTLEMDLVYQQNWANNTAIALVLPKITLCSMSNHYNEQKKNTQNKNEKNFHLGITIHNFDWIGSKRKQMQRRERER